MKKVREDLITRETLSSVRDAALNFLIVYTWDRTSSTINPRAALHALGGLRRELGKVADVLRREAP